MSDDKFTPGPWGYSLATGEVYHGEDSVAMVLLGPEANVPLIAAAPDLYAALEMLFPAKDEAWENILWAGVADEAPGSITMSKAMFDKCRAALRKARGES